MDTDTPPSPSAPQAERVVNFQRVRAIALEIGGLAERVMARKVGLPVSEARVLAAIAEYPGSIASDIATRIALTPVQVGRSLSKLKSLDLVRTEVDLADARALRLWLQPAGLEAQARAAAVTQAVQHWAVRKLDPEQWAQFDQLLDLLLASARFNEADVAALEAQVDAALTPPSASPDA